MRLTQQYSVSVKDDSKRLAILSIQVQNVKKGKVYQLSPIVLLDGDKRILPDAVKYFSGNSVIASDWAVESRPLFFPLTMTGKSNSKYTVNLIYAVDTDKEITKADIFGQVIEFDTEQVKLNVIDKFN